MPRLLQNGKIDNELAESDTNARFPALRSKNAERKILQREVRIWCDLDK